MAPPRSGSRPAKYIIYMYLVIMKHLDSDKTTSFITRQYTVKKRLAIFPVTSPNSPWPGKIKLFPARDSLVGDIPAGDKKVINLFLQ
jgi:hypothetical protein